MVAIATISPNIASPEGEGFAPSPEETEGFLPLAERMLCERGRRLADQDPQPSSRRARRQRAGEKKIQAKDEVLAQLMAAHSKFYSGRRG